MTDKEIDAAIAEVCGVRPELVEWWAYKDTPDGGSICYSAQSKEEVEKWLARLPEESWAKDYVPKAFYRYPNYSGDLNAMHEAEELFELSAKFGAHDYAANLYHICVPRDIQHEDHFICWVVAFYLLNATARQRAEAFLKTLGKWKEAAK